MKLRRRQRPVAVDPEKMPIFGAPRGSGKY